MISTADQDSHGIIENCCLTDSICQIGFCSFGSTMKYIHYSSHIFTYVTRIWRKNS